MNLHTEKIAILITCMEEAKALKMYFKAKGTANVDDLDKGLIYQCVYPTNEDYGYITHASYHWITTNKTHTVITTTEFLKSVGLYIATKTIPVREVKVFMSGKPKVKETGWYSTDKGHYLFIDFQLQTALAFGFVPSLGMLEGSLKYLQFSYVSNLNLRRVTETEALQVIYKEYFEKRYPFGSVILDNLTKPGYSSHQSITSNILTFYNNNNVPTFKLGNLVLVKGGAKATVLRRPLKIGDWVMLPNGSVKKIKTLSYLVVLNNSVGLLNYNIGSSTGIETVGNLTIKLLSKKLQKELQELYEE